VFIHDENNDYAVTLISEEESLQKATDPVPKRNCATF